MPGHYWREGEGGGGGGEGERDRVREREREREGGREGERGSFFLAGKVELTEQL